MGKRNIDHGDGTVTIVAGRDTDMFWAGTEGIVDGNIRISFISKAARGITLDLEMETAKSVCHALLGLLEKAGEISHKS